MKHLLPLLLLLLFGHSSLSGQHSLHWDAFGTTFYATEGNLNLNFAYHHKFTNRTGLQVGLSYGRYIRSTYYLDPRIPGGPVDQYEELWGIALTPEFRFYLREVSDDAPNQGLFFSPYAKAYLSWVNQEDYLLDTSDTEIGYIAGVGAGVGYAGLLGRWSITPYLGLGKGFSSHESIFQPGGYDIGFSSPDLMILRIELLVGYHF